MSTSAQGDLGLAKQPVTKAEGLLPQDCLSVRSKEEEEAALFVEGQG